MKDNTVKCPSCKEVFKVDDAVYNNIVNQVRDQQFQNEVSNRLKIAENEKKTAIELAEEKVRNTFQQELSEKQKEIDLLKEKSKSELVEEVSKKESTIKDLEAKLQQAENEKRIALQEALSSLKEEKNNEISQLKSKLENADTQKELALSNAIGKLEKEKDQLQNKLEAKDTEKELLEKSLKDDFRRELETKDQVIKYRDEEIERLKDYKQKLSTKMLGESLEQHCEIEFNKLRATAFQNAYFEKDNDASGGTKGDYIFKEADADENEVVSIMFEMKNENDTTATKKKNEDFFAKLDKDRKDKGCEYAVLVSLLESDNEYYNTGIVDVSYKYPKMYVIRPQFFIPMITLLRNAGMKSLEYKQELSVIRNQNIDVTNFEEKLNKFKEGFNKNYLNAASQFDTAMSEIDKSIDHLNKIKEALRLTSNHLRLANNKAEDLTIKKLTYNNSTMKQKFQNLD